MIEHSILVSVYIIPPLGVVQPVAADGGPPQRGHLLLGRRVQRLPLRRRHRRHLPRHRPWYHLLRDLLLHGEVEVKKCDSDISWPTCDIFVC